MLGDPETTKDVVQQIFIKLHKNRERLSGPETVGGWLFTVARHDCRRELERKCKLLHLGDEELERLQDAAEDWSQQSDQLALGRVVSAAMKHLSIDDRELLVLREYEGKSYREIAEYLDVTESTVRFRLHSARRRLFDIVKPIFRSEDQT